MPCFTFPSPAASTKSSREGGVAKAFPGHQKDHLSLSLSLRLGTATLQRELISTAYTHVFILSVVTYNS